MRLLAACLLAAACACGQSTLPLEIRGTVVEAGLGVGGATVTLFEFGNEPAQATTRVVSATAITDPRGAFRFQPARLGQYYLEVKKESYVAASAENHGAGPRETPGESVSLDREHPSRELRFSLTRLGELRGRVIDEEGNSLKGLRVVVHPPASSPSPSWTDVVTDQDGYFVAAKLKPGNYLVRIAPQRADMEVLPLFSESDLKTVDRDLEIAEWPGGGDERSASPVPVSPGASSSVGTITVRQELYYRAHVSVSPDECAAGEMWNFAAVQPAGPESAFVPTPRITCAKEFLVRNLRPGSYLFALTSGRDAEKNKWAVAPVEIRRENVEVALTISPGVDLSGRVTAADGAEAPEFGGIRIIVLPDIQGFADFALFGTRPVSVDTAGRFQVKGLQGNRLRVVVDGPGGNYYVKEIRYSGLPAPDGIITPAPGAPAQLEILLDDKAGSINGQVTDGDKPAREAMISVVKWPVAEAYTPLSFVMSAGATSDEQGRFRVDGLAPGEYRVLAVPRDAREGLSPEALIPFLNRGEKVTVERGSSLDLSLKLIDILK